MSGFKEPYDCPPGSYAAWEAYMGGDDPPDCEECGKPMEVDVDADEDGYYQTTACVNSYCPDSPWYDVEDATCDVCYHLFDYDGDCQNPLCPESPKFQEDDPREER